MGKIDIPKREKRGIMEKGRNRKRRKGDSVNTGKGKIPE